MKSAILSAAAILAGTARAWVPADRDLSAFNITARAPGLEKRFQPNLGSGVSKIRGVNFGGWLISEPWMMSNEWSNMGCNGQLSEFDCMRNVYGNNRDAGNAAFENHWKNWINADTVQSVHDVGLNTIRIPIGYWSYNDIVDTSSEPFADGSKMLPYLDAVIQKAADLGIYVIIDLHGAPGGQQQDVFTGQNPNPAGFFNDYNYGRAEKWLTWMTNRIHTTPSYQKAVGMIEVLNEPVSQHDKDNRYPAPGEDTLVSNYYGGALNAVRSEEANLGVSDANKLHVQYMDQKWLAGNPRDNSAVAGDNMVAYDDHNYIGFALSETGDKNSLLQSSCTDNRATDGENFKITGEWSMTSGVDANDGDWYKQWFTAQQQQYENPGMSGWVFWTWKTELNDPRWTYSDATSKGFIPTTAAGLEQNVYQDVCQPWR